MQTVFRSPERKDYLKHFRMVLLEEVMRGHDCWLTHKLDVGSGRLLTPSPFLGLYNLLHLPTVPTPQAISKAAALTE